MKRLLYILMIVLLPMVVVAHECDSIRIVGSVYDEKGDAIVAATLSIDGTTIGTVTDYNGWFELTMLQPTVPLSIKAKGLGYAQKNIQLADSILRNCQYNLNIELSLSEVKVDSFKYVDISFRLPIYVASDSNLAQLRRAIDYVDGSNKNTNYYDLCTQNDRTLIRTHHVYYSPAREQKYADSCVGCISVGSDWVFILDESTVEYFKRTNEMQTFSYQVIAEISCFCSEISSEIQMVK